MPLYDIQCYECGYIEERLLSVEEVPLCDSCSLPLHFKFGAEANFHPFREGMYEHIDLEPIYIKSRKQLRQECQKRGLTSHYVEGGKFSEI